MKPTLYIQTSNNHPIWDFCYAAKDGAMIEGIEVQNFEDSFEVTGDPYNIIVGSVEESRKWLLDNGYDCPEQININIFKDFLVRDSKIISFDDLQNQKYPLFVKPASQIKAFTGFTCKKYDDYFWFSEEYRGDLIIQETVDIVSEYRAFVRKQDIIGLQYYSGDFLSFPDKDFIKKCLKFAVDNLSLHAFTLDFGVLSDGSTVLIEPNDGWAIGNYGLDSRDYYNFVRDRWLQITRIRK
jgi:hypothetical protein